jgi:nitrous oxidase accessory protein
MTVPGVVAALALQGTLVVGPGAYPTIGAALRVAVPGDTVHVAPGLYREHLVIGQAAALIGEPGAVVDGEGSGTVIAVRAPASIRGFTIRGSGSDQSREDSGILVQHADGVAIEDNAFEDVLFGVYLKEADRAVIRGNTITGKDLSMGLRGDGIRLWYSHDVLVADNRLTRVRDLVIWFSNGTAVTGNEVTNSRYGLHFMYSRHNTFEENRFTENDIGAFIMYSADITFRRNLFADARGVLGRGLGFKDSDSIVAESNVFVRNSIGVSIDNSPHAVGVVNVFRGNTVAFNDVGIQVLPSVRDNVFEANDFRDNVAPVAVSGGGSALRNTWRRNYWSDYAGFDANDDGLGDTPYVHERLSDDLLARHDALAVFRLSLAAQALDVLSRVFPLLKPQPVVVDSAPRLRRGSL